MASGWANVGSAIAGNPSRQAALYEQGATGTARLEGLLSEARRRRDEESGFSGITPEAIAAAANGDPTANATIASSMFHANVNPEQLSGFQRQQLGTTIQRDAYGRVQGGASVADVNPLLAVMAGKPVEVSNVKDGVSFNPYATPDNNRFDPTQVGLAEIMQKGAQADAEHASAANSYASAARTRAGIGLDKAANYDIVDTPDGLVRVPKLGGYAVPVTFQDGTNVTKAPKATAARQPNNEQTLAAGFANRMVASTKELDALTDAGYDPTNARDRMAAGIGGYLGNEATSSTGQQFRQAATNWVRANLRKESGAAIGKDEMDQEIENYFPKAGDSQAVIEQKARNREQVNANMIQAAGPAWRGAQPSGSATAPAAVLPASAVPSSPSASSGGHSVGDVLTVGGRQYRVTGGDPNDPDLEPL